MTTQQQKAYGMIYLAMVLQESVLKAVKQWWDNTQNQLKGLTEIEATNAEPLWVSAGSFVYNAMVAKIDALVALLE